MQRCRLALPLHCQAIVATASLYGMLFGAILLDSLGLPLAAELALLAAGAAVHAGLMDPWVACATAVIAALAGHCAAYWAGRVIGQRLVPRAASFRPGPMAVFFSRFLVGVRVVLCPLAGVTRMRFRVFLAVDAAGAVVWVAAFMLLGYAGGSHVDLVREALEGSAGLLLIGAGVAALLFLLPIVRRAQTSDMDRLIDASVIAGVPPSPEGGHDLVAEVPHRRHDLLVG